jgi:hypothetical protein
MTDIEELRQRVEEAERSFGLIDEQHANYSGRLVTLIDAIRQSLDERQLAVDRVSQENEQLRTMLLSLLHAIEAGSGKGFSDIMNGIEGELSAMIAGSQGSSPVPEASPLEEADLDVAMEDAEPDTSAVDEALTGDDALAVEAAVADLVDDGEPFEEGEGDSPLDSLGLDALADDEEIAAEEIADDDEVNDELDIEAMVSEPDDDAADDLATDEELIDDFDIDLPAPAEAPLPDGDDDESDMPEEADSPDPADSDEEANDDLAAMLDEMDLEMDEGEITDGSSPEPDMAEELGAEDSFEESVEESVEESAGDSAEDTEFSAAEAEAAAEAPEGKVSDLKQILDGIRESIGDVTEDEPTDPSA